jgi:uncharacterized protein (PEP-CTERM system associated)
MDTMAIDPQGLPRGRGERFLSSGKIKSGTAAAVAACALCTSAQAQVVGPDTSTSSPSFPTTPPAISTGFPGLSIPAPLANGTPWRFGAGLEVDQTYSDNINLRPTGQERSDFVTQITPDFNFSRSGARLNALFDYSPSLLYYWRGSNGTTVRNSLNATLQTQLIENLLQFDAQAAISQQNVSPFGTQAANSVNGSENRVETRTYSMGPTLRSRFSNDLSYQLGYHYLWTDSDNAFLGRSRTNETNANVSSGTSVRDLGGTLSYDRSDQSYGNSNSIVTQQENFQLTYIVSPAFKLVGSVGYDNDSYPHTDIPDLKGKSYSGGFDWEPTRRTSANVQFGHRYFGPTANVHLQHTEPRWVVSFAYTRDQTTSSGAGLTQTVDPTFALVDQLLAQTITDPVLRAQAVLQALAGAGLPTTQFDASPFVTNQIYVQKRVDLSLGLIGLLNTVTFDVARTESQGLSALTVGLDIFNQATRIRSTIYSANWSHRLGPRTNLSATFQRVDSSAIEGAGTSITKSLYASINRQISRKLNGSVSVRHVQQHAGGDGNGLFGGNYTENAIIGSLHVSF